MIQLAATLKYMISFYVTIIGGAVKDKFLKALWMFLKSLWKILVLIIVILGGLASLHTLGLLDDFIYLINVAWAEFLGLKISAPIILGSVIIIIIILFIFQKFWGGVRKKRLLILQLEGLIREIEELRKMRMPFDQVEEEKFELWQHNVRHTLETIFGMDSKEVKRFNSVSFYPMVYPTTDLIRNERYQDGLTSSKAFLTSVVQKLR